MITWFQTTFGKHHKIILASILGVMALSLVIGMGAVPRGMANANGTGAEQKLLLGVDVNDPATVQEIERAAAFTYQLSSGQQISSDQQAQNLLFERIALMHLADEWQVPPSSQEQVDAYIRTVPMFKDKDGVFDAGAYTKFKDDIQTMTPDQREFYINTLAENARLQGVGEIVGGPGYVIPYNAKLLWSFGHAQYDLDVATLDMDKFEPKIDINDAVLIDYFTKNIQSFQRPPQVRLSYVKIPAAPVPDPTTDQLRTFATDHKDQFPDLKPDDLADKDKAAPVAAAWKRAQQSAAADKAGAQAMAFDKELYALNVPRTDPKFAALLAKYNLTVQPPVNVTLGKPAPADSPVPDDILQQAASAVSAQQYFSERYILPDGAAVFFLDDSTPARTPSFTEVRDEVTTAYKNQEKTRQFDARGQELRLALEKSVADGKTFADAATALGLTVKNYTGLTEENIQQATMNAFTGSPPNAAATPNPADGLGKDLLMSLENPGAGAPLLMTLHQGDVSPMVTLPDAGVFLRVAKREEPVVAEDSPDLKNITQEIAGREAGQNANLILSGLVNDAMKKLQPAAGASAPTPAPAPKS